MQDNRAKARAYIATGGACLILSVIFYYSKDAGLQYAIFLGLLIFFIGEYFKEKIEYQNAEIKTEDMIKQVLTDLYNNLNRLHRFTNEDVYPHIRENQLHKFFLIFIDRNVALNCRYMNDLDLNSLSGFKKKSALYAISGDFLNLKNFLIKIDNKLNNIKFRSLCSEFSPKFQQMQYFDFSFDHQQLSELHDLSRDSIKCLNAIIEKFYTITNTKKLLKNFQYWNNVKSEIDNNIETLSYGIKNETSPNIEINLELKPNTIMQATIGETKKLLDDNLTNSFTNMDELKTDLPPDGEDDDK